MQALMNINVPTADVYRLMNNLFMYKEPAHSRWLAPLCVEWAPFDTAIAPEDSFRHILL